MLYAAGTPLTCLRLGSACRRVMGSGGGRFYFPLQEKKIKRIFFLALQGSYLLIEGFNRDCLALQQFQGANCRCACFMGWDGMGYNGIQWGGIGWGQLWACLLNLPNLWV